MYVNKKKEEEFKLSVMVRAYNPSTREVKAK
jgi:hypothetical protein